jgi:hypothetical protein
VCTGYTGTDEEVNLSCGEYVEAILRKEAIADYHSKCLEPLLLEIDGREPVPVPVQAHFEGLLYSVIACADQTAAGLYAVAGLGQSRRGLDRVFVAKHASVLEKSHLMGELKALWTRGEMFDVREIRRRAAHLYYDKDGRGEHYYVREYQLRPERFSGGGPISERELGRYCGVALELGHALSRLGTAAVRAFAGR